MTRDEAITENCKYFRTTLQIQAMTRSGDEIRKMAAAQADLYVALGMLKLDEPKSGNIELYNILNKHVHLDAIPKVLHDMVISQLEVIKK